MTTHISFKALEKRHSEIQAKIAHMTLQLEDVIKSIEYNQECLTTLNGLEIASTPYWIQTIPSGYSNQTIRFIYGEITTSSTEEENFIFGRIESQQLDGNVVVLVPGKRQKPPAVSKIELSSQLIMTPVGLGGKIIDDCSSQGAKIADWMSGNPSEQIGAGYYDGPNAYAYADGGGARASNPFTILPIVGGLSMGLVFGATVVASNAFVDGLNIIYEKISSSPKGSTYGKFSKVAYGNNQEIKLDTYQWSSENSTLSSGESSICSIYAQAPNYYWNEVSLTVKVFVPNCYMDDTPEKSKQIKQKLTILEKEKFALNSSIEECNHEMNSIQNTLLQLKKTESSLTMDPVNKTQNQFFSSLDPALFFHGKTEVKTPISSNEYTAPNLSMGAREEL